MGSLGGTTVAPANGTANRTVSDVIGNRTDSHTASTLYGRMKTQNEHVHHAAMVYPTLPTADVVLTSGGAGALGAIVEVIPAATVTSDFDVHWINISTANFNDIYELVLYKGAALSEVEIARARFARSAVQDLANGVPVTMDIQAANERISAAVGCVVNAGKTCALSLAYHLY